MPGNDHGELLFKVLIQPLGHTGKLMKSGWIESTREANAQRRPAIWSTPSRKLPERQRRNSYNLQGR